VRFLDLFDFDLFISPPWRDKAQSCSDYPPSRSGPSFTISFCAPTDLCCFAFSWQTTITRFLDVAFFALLTFPPCEQRNLFPRVLAISLGAVLYFLRSDPDYVLLSFGLFRTAVVFSSPFWSPNGLSTLRLRERWLFLRFFVPAFLSFSFSLRDFLVEARTTCLFFFPRGGPSFLVRGLVMFSSRLFPWSSLPPLLAQDVGQSHKPPAPGCLLAADGFRRLGAAFFFLHCDLLLSRQFVFPSCAVFAPSLVFFFPEPPGGDIHLSSPFFP